MSTRPTLLKFYLDSNEDQEITCMFCTLPKCELSFIVRGGGKVQLIGVHNDCAEKHCAHQTKTAGALTTSTS